MSVNVRPYRRGGWEVDVRVLLPDGRRRRERRRAPVSSKTAALRWGQARERELLIHRPAVPTTPRKEVPTLQVFAERFLDGYARANRQKPSTIVTKESLLRVHLAPLLGAKRLNAVTNEDVQRLKGASAQPIPQDREQRSLGPERAPEDGSGVGGDRPDAVHDSAGQGVTVVGGVSRLRYLRPAGGGGSCHRPQRLLRRSPWGRSRPAAWRDDGARMDRHRPSETPTVRSTVLLGGTRNYAEGGTVEVYPADRPPGEGAT